MLLRKTQTTQMYTKIDVTRLAQWETKMLRIMKLIIILLTVAALQVSAKGHSQGITLSLKDVSLKTAFVQIRKAAPNFDFFYDESWLKDANKVSIDVKNASLNEVLEQCFKDQPFTFSIAGSIITVHPKNNLTIAADKNSLLNFTIKGVIINEANEPVEGASVKVKNTDKGTSTNEKGEFTIEDVNENSVLEISHITYETQEIKVNKRTEINISLKAKVGKLVDVVINTGYQKIPKERSPGSFGFINNEQINRKAGTDILSRMEGAAVGVLFDRRQLAANQSAIGLNNILIRGLSTMTESIRGPLVVVDNFPYNGDINNINPNDVENITILKDAAAASIYGSKAGNGVIVITTKHGQFNQPFKLYLNNNIQIFDKPNLFKYPKMSSSDFIDFETFLFGNNFYDGDLTNPRFPALSPVVEILNKRLLNQLSSSDSAAQIQNLRNSDLRNDFEKYIYKTSINNQYALSLSGGGSILKYSISGGYDRTSSNLVGNEGRRITLRSNNTLMPVKNLEIGIGLAYANSLTHNNSLGDIGASNYSYRNRTLFPYAQFADFNGNHLAVDKDYRAGYTDTAGNGKLLDWKFRPLDELKNNDNSNKLEDLVLNINASYKLTSFLTLNVQYEYEHTTGSAKNFHSDQTYFTRNLINLFSQIQGPDITYMIPQGGIMDLNYSELTAHQARTLLNFTHSWKTKHRIYGFVGGEIRETKDNKNIQRLYGFDANTYSNSNVDYISRFPQYGNRGTSIIPSRSGIGLLTDHIVSVYGNGAYTYADKYTFSASVRKDAANLFGVSANNRWKPFWTVGGSWDIFKESYYKSKLFPELRLRATYGYQGNVNNSLSPYTILGYLSASNNIFNIPSAGIVSPANPELSWESINQLNLGLDFTVGSRVGGSIDVFKKKSNNLIWDAPIDPTTGRASVKSNSASMIGKGIEAKISSTNIKGWFEWRSELGFSHIINTVTNYAAADVLDKLFTGSSLISSGLTILGFRKSSPYAIYSYNFAGLDPSTGDPLGYLGKSVSKDYTAIFDQFFSDTANIKYHGSAIPTTYGFFNNIFRYKGFSLLVNINYSFGYYFRKSTISYYDLINAGAQHPDYPKRWKAAGDEQRTTVPSLIYPLSDSKRDDFYANSSANVLKGDNIRLKNIRVSYDLNTSSKKNFPVKNIQMYGNIENLGIIWRANKEGLDPDYDVINNAYPVPKVFTAGFNIEF
jgi:TonB-linked SusC/RagA family outer membrane protein